MYYSGAIGYLRAMQLYKAGRLKSMNDVVNYVSDTMATTQQMYDRYNRPPILNSKILSGENPAQSFKLGLLNATRETLGNTIGKHTEVTGKEAVARTLSQIVFMAANTFILNEAFGHKTFTATTGIPYASAPIDAVFEAADLDEKAPALKAFMPNRYGSGGYSEGLLLKFTKASEDIAKGNHARAASRVARVRGVGGAQAARILQTIGANRGEYPFELESTYDKIIAPILGIGSTSAAREAYGDEPNVLPMFGDEGGGDTSTTRGGSRSGRRGTTRGSGR